MSPNKAARMSRNSFKLFPFSTSAISPHIAPSVVNGLRLCRNAKPPLGERGFTTRYHHKLTLSERCLMMMLIVVRFMRANIPKEHAKEKPREGHVSL
jgi:hypothetical protein